MRIPGRRLLPLSRKITASVPPPTASAAQFVAPPRIRSPIRHRLSRGPSLSIEKPNSLGSWLIRTVSAMPFM